MGFVLVREWDPMLLAVLLEAEAGTLGPCGGDPRPLTRGLRRNVAVLADFPLLEASFAEALWGIFLSDPLHY